MIKVYIFIFIFFFGIKSLLFAAEYPKFSPRYYLCDGGGAPHLIDVVGMVLGVSRDVRSGMEEVKFSKKINWHGDISDAFYVLHKYEESKQEFIVGKDYHLGLHKIPGSKFYYFDYDCFGPKLVQEGYIERINSILADEKCRLPIADLHEKAFESKLIFLGNILSSEEVTDGEFNRVLKVQVKETFKGDLSEGEKVSVFYNYSKTKECLPGSFKFEFRPSHGGTLLFLREKDGRYFISREFGDGGSVLKVSEMDFDWKRFLSSWWWNGALKRLSGQ